MHSTSRNMSERMDLPFVGLATFAGQPACTNWDKLDGADVAILGIPIDTASSYRVGTRFGPRTIRETSMFHGFGPDGVFDFEDEVTYLSADEVRIVDTGDSDVIYADTKRSLANAELAVRALLDAGAMPYILGGDHSISMATIAAYSDQRPIHIVHIDAHFDFIDARNGITWGHGSPMRRASEMAHVKGITTLGPHNMAAVSKKDYEAAKAYGTHVVPLRKFRAIGAKGRAGPHSRSRTRLRLDRYRQLRPIDRARHGNHQPWRVHLLRGEGSSPRSRPAVRGRRSRFRRGLAALRSVRDHLAARRTNEPRFHRIDLPRTRQAASVVTVAKSTNLRAGASDWTAAQRSRVCQPLMKGNSNERPH
jgi:hypothetical protein